MNVKKTYNITPYVGMVFWVVIEHSNHKLQRAYRWKLTKEKDNCYIGIMTYNRLNPQVKYFSTSLFEKEPEGFWNGARVPDYGINVVIRRCNP